MSRVYTCTTVTGGKTYKYQVERELKLRVYTDVEIADMKKMLLDDTKKKVICKKYDISLHRLNKLTTE